MFETSRDVRLKDIDVHWEIQSEKRRSSINNRLRV